MFSWIGERLNFILIHAIRFSYVKTEEDVLEIFKLIKTKLSEENNLYVYIGTEIG